MCVWIVKLTFAWRHGWQARQTGICGFGPSMTARIAPRKARSAIIAGSASAVGVSVMLRDMGGCALRRRWS